MRDLVLSLFIFSLIPYAFMQPFIGLLMWEWIGFMNPHRMTWGFAYSFPWVQLVAIVTFIALASAKNEKRRWVPSAGFIWLLVAFTVWTAITTIFAFNDDAFHQLIKFLKIQVMIFMMFILVNDRKRLDMTVWVIAFSIGFYGIKGGLFTIIHGGHNTVLGPADSFIAGTNEMAAALVMIIPLFRYLQLAATDKRVRIGCGVAIALCVIAVFGTYSRGGLIALAVAGGMLVFKSRRRFLFLAVFVVVVPFAVAFMPQSWVGRMQTIRDYKDVSSAESRIESWKMATNMALARPIVGGGFHAGASSKAFQLYAPPGAHKPRAIHSIIFQALGEQGFPGLVMFLGLLAIAWRYGSYVRKRTKNEEKRWAYDLAAMLQVSLVGYIMAGLTNPLTYHDLPYAIMALLVCLQLVVREQETAELPMAASRHYPRRTASTTPKIFAE